MIPSKPQSRTVLTLPNPLFDLFHTPNMTTNKTCNNGVYDVCFFDRYYFSFFFLSLFFFFVSFILFTFRSRVHVPKRCQCYYGNSNELAPSLVQPWFVTILTITRLVLGFSFGRFRNHILNPLLCFHFRSWSIFPPLCVGLEELLVLLLQFLPHFLTQSKR